VKNSIESHIEILSLREENSRLLQINAALQKEISELKSDNLFTKHELEKIKRIIFGSRSERFIGSEHPSQLSFNIEVPQIEQPESGKEIIVYEREKKKDVTIKTHSRSPLPSHLARQQEIIEPAHIEEGSKKIGEEITEFLEYTPGKLFVRQIIRPKYTVPSTGSIVIGNLPSLPIPKGNAGASLLAHIIISKFVDHLPFYRLIQMFKREGVELAESTVNDWFNQSCKLLNLLYECLIKEIQSKDYLMADETPIQVLTEDKPESTHKGYHWVYYSPKDKKVCFDYRKGRGREGPEDFLKTFKGTLQTDAYAAYDIYDNKKDITLLACMAHARRKFDEALSNDPERAKHVLLLIQKLYEVERKAREGSLTPEQRKQLRIEESAPVLNELEAWLKNNITEVLPKSAIGHAISYTIAIWHRLKRYIDDGNYEIDNNLIENSIRPVAIGKKNYMFAGSHEGAKRAAMIYSFVGTCKLNNVNPFDWLKDVLERISDYKGNQLSDLLPNNWKKPTQ